MPDVKRSPEQSHPDDSAIAAAAEFNKEIIPPAANHERSVNQQPGIWTKIVAHVVSREYYPS